MILTTSHLLSWLSVSRVVFVVAALMILVGAYSVVFSRNAVHSALSLVLSLFGVAIVFVAQDANFLAAVQVIVYAGAIVVLFLFVIMFLGVDRTEQITETRLRLQWWIATPVMVLVLGGLLALGYRSQWTIGAPSVAGRAVNQPGGDVAALGRSVFTTYLFPFEVTAGLLVIAVVGAVMLSRRPHPPGPTEPAPVAVVAAGAGDGGAGDGGAADGGGGDGGAEPLAGGGDDDGGTDVPARQVAGAGPTAKGVDR